MAELMVQTQEGHASIDALLKKKHLTSNQATKMHNQLNRQLKRDMALHVAKSKGIKGGPPAGAGITSDEGDEEAPNTAKIPYPCSVASQTLVAQEFASFTSAIASVRKAFMGNLLFAELPNSKAAATKRCHKPGGTGSPKNGYLDWEFNDGKLACRCVQHIPCSYAQIHANTHKYVTHYVSQKGALNIDTH